MSIEDSQSRTELFARTQKLRLELKDWERAFAASNGGRKAGREDIKKDERIARKYKEYNKLRSRTLSQDPFTQSSSSPPPSKRRKLDSPAQNHSSTLQHHEPKQFQTHPAAIDPYDPPQHASPVAMRRAIAPTPQKNGIVLGLFDMLSPSPRKSIPNTALSKPMSSKLTPSKLTPSKAKKTNLLETPSKNRTEPPAASTTVTPIKHARTPQSSAKRNYLDMFLTPSTRRFKAHMTPTIRKSKLEQTPESSKRDSQGLHTDALNGFSRTELEDVFSSPVAVRLPRKPLGKSLSTLVRGLRSIEEDQADEDLNMLREMEDEEERRAPPPEKPKILVEDSQLGGGGVEMSLGADGEGQSSELEEEDANKGRVGLDGKPLKSWKKKGQKRTTRKVNIRPSTAKWKPEPKWEGGLEDDGEEMVEETQARLDSGEAKEGSERDDGNGSAYDSGNDREPAKAKRKTKKEDVAKPEDQGEKGSKRKKIKATANPNFRALKIRNKNSKGKRGRFGRRGR